MPSEHAEYSPSAMPRIIKCPASWGRCRPIPDKESPAAYEGEMAHGCLENILRGIPRAEWVIPPGHKRDEITPEMLGAVDVAVGEINRLRENPWPVEEYIEVQVSLEAWGLPEVWGTLDYGRIGILDTLYVIDYKHGVGVPVYPDSAQLLTYAAGCTTPKDIRHFEKIVTGIIQPRCFKNADIDYAYHTPGQIRRWVDNVLKPALEDATSDDPTVCPGEDQCRFCRANSPEHCPESTQRALAVAQADFADLVGKKELPLPIAPNQIRIAYENLSLLKNWIKRFESYIREETVARRLDYTKLVAGRNSRAWKDEDAALNYLMSSTSLSVRDVVTTPVLKSPAQICEMLGKDKNKIEHLIETVPGAPAVAHINSSKPELQTAENDFGDLL